MVHQSPAIILRSVKRMTKYLEIKVFQTKPILSSVVLPGINIIPVLPSLTIVKVQSTSILPHTQPYMPSPVFKEEPQYVVSTPLLHVRQAGPDQDQQKTPNSPDVLTRKKLFEMVENLHWFKPPLNFFLFVAGMSKVIWAPCKNCPVLF
jgi:hypothetical protein